MRDKHQFRIRDASLDRQPKIQSSPVREILQKNYAADQQRLQISDLHFDKIHHTSNVCLLEDKIQDRGMYLFAIFPTEAMLWIKEVEMVDSVDDLKSSCSVRGIRMSDFVVLYARIASALNRIIHNSHFKRRVSLEEQKGPKRGPFPSWKTDRSPDLRVFLGHWSQ